MSRRAPRPRAVPHRAAAVLDPRPRHRREPTSARSTRSMCPRASGSWAFAAGRRPSARPDAPPSGRAARSGCSAPRRRR